ncbi:MAG: type II toxin-antitoxin system HicB family antitoxin [Caulobacteraceae bacterium]
MRAYVFPATLSEPYPNDFVVRFPDVPEAITGGATPQEALANAVEALEVAIEHYLDLGLPVPTPRAAGLGEHPVALAPAVAARAMLVETMAAQKLSKVALAERMGRDEKVVRRAVSGKGASLDLILAALRAAGVNPALAV